MAELAALGVADFAELDVLQDASCRVAIDAAAKKYGGLNILVNNAGTSVRKPPQDLSAAEWHKVMDTNLTAAFLCAGGLSAHAAPRPRQDHQYRLDDVDIRHGYAALCGEQGGVVRMARAMAVAWAKDNIQVNSILPGWIDTELTRVAQCPACTRKVADRTPAQRWGKPDDFAGIAVFLASPASDFITGAAIPVDGGYSVVA